MLTSVEQAAEGGIIPHTQLHRGINTEYGRCTKRVCYRLFCLRSLRRRRRPACIAWECNVRARIDLLDLRQANHDYSPAFQLLDTVFADGGYEIYQNGSAATLSQYYVLRCTAGPWLTLHRTRTCRLRPIRRLRRPRAAIPNASEAIRPPFSGRWLHVEQLG